MNLQLTAIDADGRRRLHDLDWENEDDPDEALINELADTFGYWIAKRTDKAYEVIHYALTGELEGGDGSLFGIKTLSYDVLDSGAWNGLADETQVRALATVLGAVDEASIRARLRHVPSRAYNADVWAAGEHEDRLVVDARDLVTFVLRCAQQNLGLLAELG